MLSNDTVIKKLLIEVQQGMALAERSTTCLRKGVMASLVFWHKQREMWAEFLAHYNGPSRPGHPCTNEVGNCGCMHAEQRLITNWVGHFFANNYQGPPIVMLCSYSPCTSCANAIIDAVETYRLPLHSIVYDTFTQHDPRGHQFLVDSGIPVLSTDELKRFLQDRTTAAETEKIHDTVREWE